MSSRTSRTVGGAVGILVFMLFFAELADRLSNPVSAATPTTFSVTVNAR